MLYWISIIFHVVISLHLQLIHLCSYLKQNRELTAAQLLKHGAILFRGTKIWRSSIALRFEYASDRC